MTVSNMAYMNSAYRNLYVNQTQAVKSLRSLSTGYQINSSADDAAGLAVSEKMRSQIGGLDMAYSNTMNAISMVQTAEGSLDSTSQILVRMKELAVQASDGTYTADQRAALNLEFTQLKQEMNRISGGTDYNGIKLLDGSLGDSGNSSLKFQVGANAGADQQLSFQINNMSASSLGIADMDIGTVDSAAAALEAIDNASNTVVSQRSTLGAMQNRLEHTVNNLSSSRNNLVNAESTIRDVDMAKEMMVFSQKNLMAQASQAMLSQGMNLSQQNMLTLLLR